MSKYEPLGAFLKTQKFQSVPMTFAEIERVLKFKLPASKRYPAWWSNNPSNNVMTQLWLDAGFETESVDTRGEKLVFRRKASTAKHPMPAEKKRKTIFGCMKGLMTIEAGYDFTQPLDEDWYGGYDGLEVKA